jgi:hypothetical protein
VLRIIKRTGICIFALWGTVAVVYSLFVRQADDAHSYFWFVLPYPLLWMFAKALLKGKGLHPTTNIDGFSLFAVGSGVSTAIAFTLTFETVLLNLITWEYCRATLQNPNAYSWATANPQVIAIICAISATGFISGGAASARLSQNRPLLHAAAAGMLLSVWGGLLSLIVASLKTYQLILLLVFPLPLALLGAYLHRRLIHASRG